MAAPLPTLGNLKPAAVTKVAPAVAGLDSDGPTRGPKYLQSLKLRKVAEMKPTNQVLVVGNKGVKSISAFAVALGDGVSPKGVPIRATPGLPRPDGSRVVFITFDNQTGQSLINHYGEDNPALKVSLKDVEIISMLEPMDEYPGWDGGKSRSGVVVAEAFKELLVSLRSSKDVGLLIVDHYGKFIEDAGRYYSHAKAGRPLDSKLEIDEWGPRSTMFFGDIDHLVRTCVMPGGWVIATGSRDRNEGYAKTVVKGKGESFSVKQEVVPSNWMKKIIANWANIIQVTKSESPPESKHFIWEAYVEEGRHPIFTLGASVNIGGRHIGAFQDEDAVVLPPTEDELAMQAIEQATAKPVQKNIASQVVKL